MIADLLQNNNNTALVEGPTQHHVLYKAVFEQKEKKSKKGKGKEKTITTKPKNHDNKNSANFDT